MARRNQPDGDPTLPLLLHELERTASSIDHVSDDRLRDVALAAASACIACHTRTIVALRCRAWPPRRGPAAPRRVRADVFAATRRFQEARAAYAETVSDDVFATREPLLWERAVKRGLAIEVRVARDPQGALQLVDTVLATAAGEGLWADAAGWRTSLLAWKAEAKGGGNEAAFRTAARLMNAALEQQHVRPERDISVPARHSAAS